MTTLLSSIPNVDTHYLILGGDLNCVMNTQLDHSSARVTTLSKMATELMSFMKDYGDCDPWRFLHSDTRAYSFFSHVHQTYSRIGYFLLPFVHSSEYTTIVISDHSPLLLDFRFDSSSAANSQWRLNTTLLSNDVFCTSVIHEIEEFIRFNKSDETNASLLWETLKAFLRGKIISHFPYHNGQRRKAQKDLIDKTSDIDRQYAINPTQSCINKK